MKKYPSIKFSSQPENIALLEEYLSNLTARYDISADSYSKILISLTEAVNNAIHHGNECDESKMIHVIHLHKEKDNELVFKVKHDGKGFDPDGLKDPTLDENLDKDGGRGVHLMKALSEELVYQDDGRTVEIRFKLC